MKTKKIFTIIFIIFITLLISSCGTTKEGVAGTYLLTVQNSKNVKEFNDLYEILEVNEDGTFTFYSYFEVLLESIFSTKTFVGELTENKKGKYYIKGNEISLEWIEYNNLKNIEFIIGNNELYQEITYSDGSSALKTHVYKKKSPSDRVNIDGQYVLNGDESKGNLKYYNKLLIKDTLIEAYFKNDTDPVYSGKVILGFNSAIINDHLFFINGGNVPYILEIDKDFSKLTIILNSSFYDFNNGGFHNYTMVYDKVE